MLRKPVARKDLEVEARGGAAPSQTERRGILFIARRLVEKPN
jgi:hypothetical protein